MGRLDGKIAIITGAGNGMGEATAQLFAEEGAKIIATDIQEDVLNKVVNDINSKYEGAAIAVQHDVSKEEDWDKVIKEGVEKFGAINVLINNAGIVGKDFDFEDATLKEWNKVMDIDSTSVFLGIKAVGPQMKKANGGSIINISSLAALLGIKVGTSISYTAAKGAVRSITKIAAVQYGESNIRVNSVHPGSIKTPLMEKTISQEQIDQIATFSALNKVGDPKDVAYTSVFLASDESKFISGAEILVDGGQYIKQ